MTRAPAPSDSAAPAPPGTKRPKAHLAPLLLSVMVFGWLGYWAGQHLALASHSKRSGLFVIPGFLLAWLLATAVHEAGHLLGGMTQGLRPLLYMVGPLRLTWVGGRVRVSFNRSVGLWGGLAAALPSEYTRLTERMQWMIAGGPLASVGLAVAAGLGSRVLQGDAQLFAQLVALLSGGIGFLTMVPSVAGGFSSDGAQWLEYRRGGGAAERRALVLGIVAASMSGRRPRELDRAALARALELPADPVGRLSVLAISACAAVDRGEDAGVLFAEIASSFRAYPGGFRQSLALWLAWHAVTAFGDVETAKAWLAHAKGGIVDPELRDLADATIARAEGREDDCRAAIARGLSRGPGLDPGGSIFVRDLLRKLDDSRDA